MGAAAIIRGGAEAGCSPWPRHLLTPGGWAEMAAALAADPLELIALWADTMQVYALFAGPLLAAAPVSDGAYAALSPWRPAAAGFERMIRDLWGHEPAGGIDPRPLLDHGAWALARPLSTRPSTSTGPFDPVLRPGDESWVQVPFGPVLPCIAEPVHWRLHASGEAVRQAEARLGYAHKGALVLMRSKSPRTAARFAARIAGDATVAHSVAFARAAEAALGLEAPPRAHALRGVMAELERAAVHLDTLTGLCAAAGLAWAGGQLGRLREGVLHAAEAAFGHRLMMDCVVPGGIASDIAPGAAEAVLAAVAGLAEADRLCGAALRDRLAGLGRAPVAAFAPGGVVGRAAGRPGDARIAPGYPPYFGLEVATPVLAGGDAAAQARVRLAEIAASARMVAVLLGALPDGPFNVGLPPVSGEGLGVAESARGDVWHWLRLDGGMIAAVFAADPGWRLWPLAERALEGCALEDAALITGSLAASASGVDL